MQIEDHRLTRHDPRRDVAPPRHLNLKQAPAFGVGGFRSSSRAGNVGRVVSASRPPSVLRPHQAWKRRSGFVGQGSSVPLGNPYGSSATLTANPAGPPVPPPQGLPTGQPQGVPLDPYGGGQQPHPPTAPPPYPCPPGFDARWWDFNRGVAIDHASSMGCSGGVTMHCDTEQPCGVNVIGANTLGTEGIPPGEVVPLNITAGDATKFRTKAIYFEALPFGDPDLVDIGALPPSRATMPLILVDALVGRISQLRRGGSPDVGLTQGGYANTKELVPVDWAPFTSTTEHNLALLLFNPNRGITVHAFVALWGEI